MIKNAFILILLVMGQGLNAQIRVESFDLTIETEMSDTLQKLYTEFLNNDVETISIIELKKKYNHQKYYQFLKHKKFYQSRKKWIKSNSFEESIIVKGKSYDMIHFDSIVFDYRFKGIDKEFIQSERVLDSTETRMALKEMFNGTTNEIVNLCYIPRHAVLFYNSKGRVTGIYEICFECSNVQIGIVGTVMFAKKSPYIRHLFEMTN